MKILLINPPWARMLGGSLEAAPLGLCYVAAVIEEQGYDVSIYNADYKRGLQLTSTVDMTGMYKEYLRVLKDINHPLWREIGAVISKQSPDLVGISVMTAKYGSALNVSKIVKNYNPIIPVVWGGIHPTILPDETIKNKDVDIIVRGEGEYSFLELIKNLENLNGVLGISYKKNGKVIHNKNRPPIENLDELPFPARHLILEKENYHPETFGNVFSTRGCPYNCIFCASHNIWTKKVRYRSPENIVDEIKEIKKEFKTNQFRFEDDCFTLKKKFVDGVCDLLIKEKLHIKWTTETRANLVTDELIKKMKYAGCEDITIGVESGDEETLKKMKKGITLKEIRNANKIIKENKMKFSAFFMIGFPWETKKEINKTISLMKELDPRMAVLSVATPYPGSELYEICKLEGLLSKDIDWSTFFHQSPDMYLTKNLTKEETSKLIAEAEEVFEEHNAKKWRAILLSDPLYIIRRFISGNYYNPKDVWTLFQRYIIK
jgi:anaerobic magnesium-protoporphyrin IX monomethyl ester cyclase